MGMSIFLEIVGMRMFQVLLLLSPSTQRKKNVAALVPWRHIEARHGVMHFGLAMRSGINSPKHVVFLLLMTFLSYICIYVWWFLLLWLLWLLRLWLWLRLWLVVVVVVVVVVAVVVVVVVVVAVVIVAISLLWLTIFLLFLLSHAWSMFVRGKYFSRTFWTPRDRLNSRFS